MTTADSHRHTHRIRVRYCETDRMGVAHHGSHVDWIEEARTEWMRELGMSYRAMEESGVFLQVVDVHVTYRASVTYDDVVEIETFLRERKRAQLTIGYVMRRGSDGKVMGEASTTLACVDAGGRLRRLPEGI